ncbi:MAG TPA: hypothetical protein VFS29_12815 [Motilibacteraceae bacterium]|nr:hypothetical protein [Motilibacteraceae bacterium]
MIPFLAVGALFVLAGVLIRPRRRPDEVQVRGWIAESWRGHSLGDPANLCTVAFRDAEGTVWRFRPPLSSMRRRVVGAPVEVAYSPSDPQGTARKTDGLDGRLHWVVMGVGVLAAAFSLFAG